MARDDGSAGLWLKKDVLRVRRALSKIGLTFGHKLGIWRGVTGQYQVHLEASPFKMLILTKEQARRLRSMGLFLAKRGR